MRARKGEGGSACLTAGRIRLGARPIDEVAVKVAAAESLSGFSRRQRAPASKAA
jgi:hypothetical protein